VHNTCATYTEVAVKKLLALVAVSAFLVGCASAPPEPQAPDLAGVYSFTTTVQGMPIDGQMRITGEPGAYAGSLYSQFTGELQFTSVTQSGDAVTLTTETPDGPVEINIVLSGETFTGDWSMGMEGGTLNGRKIR
jgi:hypothetical protein